ncbi:hypothetical protein DM01DRAFT_1332620 [Hesseltinella vesiculosa]|uniref:GDP/GTP exchange factor Sec2 N-terminal domain-containing protein n=1 Tax=Hesseltinella vesiculosa TaxID=101127 RepID=A0A1X2GSL9_9FUNG|nr:hypothetical protein DM01DRAFT_1332620 [Hesseltinella vesiculosa]
MQPMNVFLQVPAPTASISSPTKQRHSGSASWAALVSPLPEDDTSYPSTPTKKKKNVRPGSPQEGGHCHRCCQLQREKETWLQQYHQQKEISLRAEHAMHKMQLELEELSASLFAAANQMVASERRARLAMEKEMEQL